MNHGVSAVVFFCAVEFVFLDAQLISLLVPPAAAVMPSALWIDASAGSATVLLRTCTVRPSLRRMLAVTRRCIDSVWVATITLAITGLQLAQPVKCPPSGAITSTRHLGRT